MNDTPIAAPGVRYTEGDGETQRPNLRLSGEEYPRLPVTDVQFEEDALRALVADGRSIGYGVRGRAFENFRQVDALGLLSNGFEYGVGRLSAAIDGRFYNYDDQILYSPEQQAMGSMYMRNRGNVIGGNLEVRPEVSLSLEYNRFEFEAGAVQVERPVLNGRNLRNKDEIIPSVSVTFR